jgi:hypothetical protein
VSAATAEQLAQMDASIREVRLNYAVARAQALAVRTATWTTLGSWLTPDNALQHAKAIEDTGPLIDAWATVRRRWALLGQRDDGTLYSVRRFLEQGDDLRGAIATYRGGGWEGSALSTALSTVGATTVAVVRLPEKAIEAVSPTGWIFSTKAALAVGVALVALVALRR